MLLYLTFFTLEKMRPVFYGLTPELASDDLVKLDGLASGFMINHNDYSDFYDSMLQISCSNFNEVIIYMYTYNFKIH